MQSPVVRIETHQYLPTEFSTRVLMDAQKHLGLPIEGLTRLQVYRIATSQPRYSSLIDQIESVFVDELLEAVHWSDPFVQKIEPPSWTIEVQYRPGVTDNAARSAEEALSLLGVKDPCVSTGVLWCVYGTLKREDIHRFAHELLANSLIQQVYIRDRLEMERWKRFEQVQLPRVELSTNQRMYEVYDHRRPLKDWLHWSREQCWALNAEEIAHIQRHYSHAGVNSQREVLGLPREPTDVEIEIIAQSWSEHCKHKIFAAQIEYVEGRLGSEHVSLGSKKIDSLFKTYIQQATSDVEHQRGLSWLRSVFHDNAGVVAFDDSVDVSIKVETHNSPSALDPYGGAITGILGVNRDILGVGLGSKPIANMDVFCVADPSWPLDGDAERMPVGLKTPRRLLEGIHKGVQDGGNMSGIPTVNGAFFFDQDYAGKPLVFVGTVGVMPKRLNDGRDGVQNQVSVGDNIVMVGGAIGADGIHGATFSSLTLDEHAPATAVQIGDAITQRRMSDFLLEARDLGLFSCLTDNGAGGLSSSVGEMAVLSNGACLDLALAPTKYPNLKPWELMVSESQERMTVAVPPKSLDAFLRLAEKRGVVATRLGTFTDTGFLEVFFDEQRVAHLSLDFLHNSLPQMKLQARWDGPVQRNSWIDKDLRQDPTNHTWIDKLKTLLSAPNVVSKEDWVRQYDHEVQGATIGKPFGGASQQGPNDAGVIWLHPHGGSKESAISVGCGLAPRLSLYDPYWMAQRAFDEAIRNIVSTGANIDQTCALDNFCWPNPILSEQVPDGDVKLGQLVRCCVGLYDICIAYGVPLVSGKDSMKNDFRGRNGLGEPLNISILPTLLVTALGRCPVSARQDSAFKTTGDRVVRLGLPSVSLLGSEFAEQYVVKQTSAIEMDLECNRRLYRFVGEALKQGLLQSIHDISDGGLLCAVVESCVGNGLSVSLQVNADDESLFGEGAGGFVVSVSETNLPEMLTQLDAVAVSYEVIGTVTNTGDCVLNGQAVSMSTLIDCWTRTL